MYIILFVLLLFALLFHEIISPFAHFFVQYQIPIMCVFFAVFIIYSIYYGRKHRNIWQGIGIFLAMSQFWFFVLVALLGISDIVSTESDVFISSFIAILVGVIAFAYASFNYKMLSNANEESNGHPMYNMIVGVVGWIINALILF